MIPWQVAPQQSLPPLHRTRHLITSDANGQPTKKPHMSLAYSTPFAVQPLPSTPCYSKKRCFARESSTDFLPRMTRRGTDETILSVFFRVIRGKSIVWSEYRHPAKPFCALKCVVCYAKKRENRTKRDDKSAIPHAFVFPCNEKSVSGTD